MRIEIIYSGLDGPDRRRVLDVLDSMPTKDVPYAVSVMVERDVYDIREELTPLDAAVADALKVAGIETR